MTGEAELLGSGMLVASLGKRRRFGFGGGWMGSWGHGWRTGNLGQRACFGRPRMGMAGLGKGRPCLWFPL